MANHDDSLKVIQVRVPQGVHDALVELQHESRDLYLSAYCRRVLVEHVENHNAKSKNKKGD